MKLRPVQLVCLALLLATLRLADPAALAPDDFALRAGVLNVLLRTELATQWSTARPQALRARGIPAPTLRTARAAASISESDVTVLEARWTMPPPAVQSAAVQSFTSFLRA